MEKSSSRSNGTYKEETEVSNNNRAEKVKPLPAKKFEVRDSLISILCRNPHIKVVKHIFTASLVGLFIHTAAHDLVEHGEFRMGFNLIITSMGKFHCVAAIWIALNMCAILAYFCFNIWANVRISFPPKGKKLKIWDISWLLALAGYYILQFRIVSVLVGELDLPVGSSAVVCLEQTRLLMKVHAFVRTNAVKVLNFKPHSDKQLTLARFKHFAYFLHAPTLVYCDEYPRSKIIRWNLVLKNSFELVGVLYYYAFLYERFVLPNHHNIGIRPYSVRELVLMMLDNCIIGLLSLLLGFYMVLDLTQNIFGELMKFGDRQFYLDWWTATSYSQYFRTWNILVGDWLYMYIYKDVYEHIFPGNKTLAKLLVFLVSAVVHEWVLTYMFGFFFPALFLCFLFSGATLSFVRNRQIDFMNVLFWYFLALGSGFLSSAYTMEWFARVNVPIENPSLRDFIVPRLFTCNCIYF